jgi:hypothetical protein
MIRERVFTCASQLQSMGKRQGPMDLAVKAKA